MNSFGSSSSNAAKNAHIVEEKESLVPESEWMIVLSEETDATTPQETLETDFFFENALNRLATTRMEGSNGRAPMVGNGLHL